MAQRHATAQMPLVEAVRLSLHDETEHLPEKLQQACSDDREEAVAGVHESRVALRRSLVVLKQIRPWADRKWVDQRRKNRRFIMRRLSGMRDSDVLLDEATRIFAGSTVSGGRELLADLTRKRRKEHEALCRCLTGKEALRRIGQEIAAVSFADAALRMLPVPVDERGNVRLYRVADCLPVMMWQAAAAITVYNSVIRTQSPAGTQADEALPDGETAFPEAPASDAVLHRLRLAAKNFRYSLVFASPWFGSAADQLIERFKSIQGTLGQWHDHVLAGQYLQKMQKETGPTEAIIQWQNALQKEKELLQGAFLKQWQIMRPEWIAESLAVCLDNMHSLEPCDCAVCPSCDIGK